jgi:hypothetical protein
LGGLNVKSDPAVKELQAIFVEHGYLTAAEVLTGPGILGPKTRGAISRLLIDRGIKAADQGQRPADQGQRPKDESTRKTGPVESPVTVDGVPLYAQGDERWGGLYLGGSSTRIRRAGCAMTATAMAISKISGVLIDPGQLEEYLDAHHGYAGTALKWDVAAQSRGLKATWPFPAWSLATIDKELEAGRPVVAGVDYRPGSGGGGGGTDHWVTITARSIKDNKVTYTAHDPANGKRFTFSVSGSRLKTTKSTGAANDYITSGELRTFYRPANKTRTSGTGKVTGKTTGVAVKPKLFFNGAYLSWIWPDGSKPSHSWKAVSGRSGSQSKEFQKIADKGPIPEGEWLVSRSKYQAMGDRSYYEMLKNEMGGGKWPGGESSWGKHRIWLQAKPGTKTHGRSGFTIHGGDEAGSAGCIDLTDQLDSFIKVFLEYGKDVDLTVKYE